MKLKIIFGVFLLTFGFSSVVSADNKIKEDDISNIKNENRKTFIKGAVFAMLASWSYSYATAAEGLMIGSVVNKVQKSLEGSTNPWAQAFLKEFVIVVKLNVTKAITPLITVFTILYVDRVLNKSVTCEDANAAITLANSSKQKKTVEDVGVEETAPDMSAGAGSGGCGCC